MCVNGHVVENEPTFLYSQQQAWMHSTFYRGPFTNKSWLSHISCAKADMSARAMRFNPPCVLRVIVRLGMNALFFLQYSTDCAAKQTQLLLHQCGLFVICFTCDMLGIFFPLFFFFFAAGLMELFTSSAEGGLRTAREEEGPVPATRTDNTPRPERAGLQTIITSLTSLGLVRRRK